MNRTFTIVDKNNNIQKNATAIIKFSLENKDYLIYCVDENEENRQVFVSRLILNSEGKYFIENILPEEKSKLSDIVYNILILTPTNYKKGENSDTLLNNLTEKFKISLSCDIPQLNMQEYYNNCSIAITSKELVSLAIEFFANNLIKTKSEPEVKIEVPTWNIPTNGINEIPQAMPNVEINSSNINTPTPPANPQEALNIIGSNEPVVAPIPNVSINEEPTLNPLSETSEVAKNENIKPMESTNIEQQNNMPNPQTEKLAVVSDPSLVGITGINQTNTQPNMAKLNNKGKANVKYIVIGTICILLAIAVVIVAYILIQKKTTGV